MTNSAIEAALTFHSRTKYVMIVNDTGEERELMGILQSRVLWFAASQISQPLRLRAGLWQYRLIRQFMSRLPIPAVSSARPAS